MKMKKLVSLALALVMVLLAYVMMSYTKFGRRVVALGGNEKNAFLSGINVTRYKMAVYAISGLSKMGDYTPKEYLDYHLSFYAGGLTSVLIHWMQDKERISSDALIDLLANEFALPYFN